MVMSATRFGCPDEVTARLTTWASAAQTRAAAAIADAVLLYGRVEQVGASLITAAVPRCQIGDLCELQCLDNERKPLLAEAIGFERMHFVLAPLGPTGGLAPGTLVRSLGRAHDIAVSEHLFGQVLDGLGRPLSAAPAKPDHDCKRFAVLGGPPVALSRPRIVEAVPTGVRAIDALLTLGLGQRVGIFAGPGCGKTTLLGALARSVAADAVVLALVGERGRELNEFLEREFDPALAARAVVVSAGAERPAMERVRAAFTATAIAEGLCEDGKHVLLLVDSLTRVARAQREIGFANGEPPSRGGFPPSVYAMLPRLTERAGALPRGSITAVYTVLTEAGPGDAIAEEARSLLDGHIVLSDELAQRGHFPAIDLLASLSRTMDATVAPPHRSDAAQVRALLSRYRDLQLLLTLGEYEPGHDAHNDDAVARYPGLMAFLRQDLRTPCSWHNTLERLHAVCFE
ncbi:FliI/YscN family ATPase [Trinickia sp. LjRoot230]|uniref:FliI/YscN family ATPase n=1 Tax=Trinickia sp. LjRoot230 TaxID=3342288 RepID=UPI003ED0261E